MRPLSFRALDARGRASARLASDNGQRARLAHPETKSQFANEKP